MWTRLNGLARQLESELVKLQFWPLSGTLRISGFLDAPYRTNEDVSSQRHYDSIPSRSARTFLEGWNVIWNPCWERKSEDHHEMFRFMPVAPWTVGGLIKLICRYPHEDWREELGQWQQKEFTNLNNPHDFHVAKRSLFRKYSWSCWHSDSELIGRLFDEVICEAGNLITAVKTGRLLDVDVHPNFRTLMEHKAFLSTWCAALMHTRETEVFFSNALKISLAPTYQEGSFQVMTVET